MPTHSNGLLAGSKFDSNHGTVVKEARKVIRLLADQPDVTKITIGVINPYGSTRRVKFHYTGAGFRMDVYTSDGIQEFHVYTKNRDKVKEIVGNFWKKLYS